MTTTLEAWQPQVSSIRQPPNERSERWTGSGDGGTSSSGAVGHRKNVSARGRGRLAVANDAAERLYRLVPKGSTAW